MKKIKLLLVCMICYMGISAQTVLNTGYLQVTLNRNVMLGEGGSCLLDSVGDTVYMHSGAGYKTISSVWDVVVGNWGLADGVGQMSTVSDSIQTICLNLTATGNYYQNPATYNADSGALPVGANIYNIGVVFRAPTGFPVLTGGGFGLDTHLKGAGPTIDSRSQCEDIWLLGVNSDSIGHQVQPVVIEGENLDPVPAVTVQWVDYNTCSGIDGVQDISAQLFDFIKVSPNPFKDNVTISFNMVPDVTKVTAHVYDVLGRQVADLTPLVKAGHNSFNWNGSDANGIPLTTGTYLLKVTNGSQIQTKTLVKL